MDNLAATKMEILRHVCEGKVSRGTAAQALGVTPRTVNRWMKKRKLRRATRIDRAAAKRIAKQNLRDFVAGMEPEEASKIAGVSLRTIYRWQAKTLIP